MGSGPRTAACSDAAITTAQALLPRQSRANARAERRLTLLRFFGHRHGHVLQGSAGQGPDQPRALSASISSAAWPFGSTFGNTLLTLPEASITNVTRLA